MKEINAKTIIVTGAQFSNKGAQSLLFSFITEIRKRFPGIKILYIPLDSYASYNQSELNFDVIYQSETSHRYEQNAVQRIKITSKYIIKKILRRQTVSLSNIRALHQAYKRADALVDLSGYQLSSEWDIKINMQFLRYLQEAQRHSVPVILFPQSFGPFEYGENQTKMDTLIKSTLEKADCIYAREGEGYRLLTQKYHLQNVRQASDFVLQCGEPDMKCIYRIDSIEKNIENPPENAVAIIPNFQNFNHGNSEQVMDVYRCIIDTILGTGKTIVIFRHSADMDVCRKIYSFYQNNEKVTLNELEYSCVEYSRYIAGFSYIVAARYHAIVHAYKAGIPAIILGWTNKYQELSKIFGQEQYLINTSENNAAELIQKKVVTMDNGYRNESIRIRSKLQELRSAQCIETVAECLNHTK